nr:peptidylprolyl isomerase [Bacteroidota bacterium]
MKRSLLTLLLVAFVTAAFSQSRSFTGKPRYDILTKRVTTTLVITTVELFPIIAPLHVNNFDRLVSFQFFDTTAFHRVIPGFMIQGGDPNSRSGPRATWGNGDPSQPTVNAEFTAAKHLRGSLSAARDASINSANSQFFICVAPAAWLNGQYSVYG